MVMLDNIRGRSTIREEAGMQNALLRTYKLSRADLSRSSINFMQNIETFLSEAPYVTYHIWRSQDNEVIEVQVRGPESAHVALEHYIGKSPQEEEQSKQKSKVIEEEDIKIKIDNEVQIQVTDD